jgi:hypothetical protein
VSGQGKKRLSNLLTDSSLPTNVGVERLPNDNPTDNLMALVQEFQKVDLASPTAKLNEMTMSDNNGGRIEL